MPPDPEFLQRLESFWIDRPTQHRREVVDVLKRFFAATLLGLTTRFEKAVFFKGEAGTGKSTLIQIFESFFEPEVRTSVNPADFGNANYWSKFEGKLLNTFKEVSEDEFDWQGFKLAVSGEGKMADGKYQKSRVVAPRCAHVLAGNDWPDLRNASSAVFDRLITIPVTNRFRETSEADPNIVKKTAGDLSNMLRWALEGFFELHELGGYGTCTIAREAHTEWKRSGDVVYRFVEARMKRKGVAGSTGTLDVSQVHREFVRFCQDERHTHASKMNLHTFRQRLLRCDVALGSNDETDLAHLVNHSGW